MSLLENQDAASPDDGGQGFLDLGLPPARTADQAAAHPPAVAALTEVALPEAQPAGVTVPAATPEVTLADAGLTAAALSEPVPAEIAPAPPRLEAGAGIGHALTETDPPPSLPPPVVRSAKRRVRVQPSAEAALQDDGAVPADTSTAQAVRETAAAIADAVAALAAAPVFAARDTERPEIQAAETPAATRQTQTPRTQESQPQDFPSPRAVLSDGSGEQVPQPSFEDSAMTIAMEHRTVKTAAWMLGLTAGFGFVTMVCAIWGLYLVLHPPLAAPPAILPAAADAPLDTASAPTPAPAATASAPAAMPSSAPAAVRHHHRHKVKTSTSA